MAVHLWWNLKSCLISINKSTGPVSSYQAAEFRQPDTHRPLHRAVCLGCDCQEDGEVQRQLSLPDIVSPEVFEKELEVFWLEAVLSAEVEVTLHREAVKHVSGRAGEVQRRHLLQSVVLWVVSVKSDEISRQGMAPTKCPLSTSLTNQP